MKDESLYEIMSDINNKILKEREEKGGDKNINNKKAIANRLFKELIYGSTVLDNLNVTYLQTETILDGVMANGTTLSQVQTILNLKHAWQRMLKEEYKGKLDLKFICDINFEIARGESLEWGVLRYGNVSVGGTDYIPPIPDKDEIKDWLTCIDTIKEPTERALELFANLIKRQLFWDGNKRTSLVIANYILINEGIGVLIVKDKNIEEFNTRLNDYYNDEYTKEEFKQFLKTLVVTE